MTHLVAIQPDDRRLVDEQPWWERWAGVIRTAGHDVRIVDVYAADIVAQLHGCDGFMWRHSHAESDRLIARNLLPVIENELGIPVFPDRRTGWHYDDKIAQAYLFAAKEIPTPETTVWHDREAATRWARTARYPQVIKLASGASGTNVARVDSFEEAQVYIERAFGWGMNRLAEAVESKRPGIRGIARRWLRAARYAVAGTPPYPLSRDDYYWRYHKGYVLFQEFLPGNPFDIRVTVIGDRAFAYRRMNREGDFRASGSGSLDHDPAKIDPAAVRLAFDAARRLGTQSAAFDLLRGDGRFVITEVSYAFPSRVVHECPGRWDGDLNWHEGRTWPQDAQARDFLRRLDAGRGEAGR